MLVALVTACHQLTGDHHKPTASPSTPSHSRPPALRSAQRATLAPTLAPNRCRRSKTAAAAWQLPNQRVICARATAHARRAKERATGRSHARTHNKAKYRRRQRTVAAMTSSLSLAVAPMAGSARNLPGKEANSACAQAQACWEREAASGRKQVGRARAAVRGACGRRRSEVQGERTYASDGAEQDGEPPEGAVVGGVSPAATPTPPRRGHLESWLPAPIGASVHPPPSSPSTESPAAPRPSALSVSP